MKGTLDCAVVLLALSFLGAWPAPSNNAATAPGATPSPSPIKPCEAPEFRQFDFWIGIWTVRTSDGKEAGKSEITRASDGCAIREQWKGASGVVGTSLNYYDPAAKRWHQDWIGGDGIILHLQGGFEGGAMTLSEDTKAAGGATTTNRITWTPLPEGKVKQEWSASENGGKTWKTLFLGIYSH